jgi:hypothetical protein
VKARAGELQVDKDSHFASNFQQTQLEELVVIIRQASRVSYFWCIFAQFNRLTAYRCVHVRRSLILKLRRGSRGSFTGRNVQHSDKWQQANCIRFFSFSTSSRLHWYTLRNRSALARSFGTRSFTAAGVSRWKQSSKQELQDKDSHFASNFIPADATGRTGCYQQVSLTFVSHLAQSDRAVRSFDSFSLRSCSPFRDKLRRSFTAGNMEHTSFR